VLTRSIIFPSTVILALAGSAASNVITFISFVEIFKLHFVTVWLNL